MVKKILVSGALLIFVMPAKSNAEDPVKSYNWEINSLTNIGGDSVEVIGNPEVVSTDKGNVVRFDGDGDMLLVDNNPIEDAKEFTVEMIFKPEGTNYAQRIIQIGTENNERVMIEIRVKDGGWSIDGFISTDLGNNGGNLTLLDESKHHPMNVWQHVAITFRNDTFKTYVNGIVQSEGTVGYNEHILPTIGKTSIGARMNQVYWFKGEIKTLRITHKALGPSEFLTVDQTTGTAGIPSGNLFIYPNPVNTGFKIGNPDKYFNANITAQIFDNTGKLVYHTLYGMNELSQELTINTGSMNSGIYFLRLNSANKTFTQKLIIKQ